VAWLEFRRVLFRSCSLLTDSCHPDDGGDTFLRNVGSYKSHTASHPRRCHSTFLVCFMEEVLGVSYRNWQQSYRDMPTCFRVATPGVKRTCEMQWVGSVALWRHLCTYLFEGCNQDEEAMAQLVQLNKLWICNLGWLIAWEVHVHWQENSCNCLTHSTEECLWTKQRLSGYSVTLLKQWRMATSGMLRRVALVWTVVSEEPMIEAPSSYETSVLTRATQPNVPEDAILHSHRSGNPKSYSSKLAFCTRPWCHRSMNQATRNLVTEFRNQMSILYRSVIFVSPFQDYIPAED
jgi:hypothetical protein